MNFIEIGDTIINLDQIKYVEQIKSEYSSEVKNGTVIYFGSISIGCGPEYYAKIMDLVKPVRFVKND